VARAARAGRDGERPAGDEAGAPDPFEPFPADGRWVGLFETHRLLDAVLAE